ncbi:MAG: alpha-amylase MalA [Halobacteriota archaeon]
MHHPGPPRFVTVGDAVELAPRNPVPEASYEWHVARAPPASDARLGDAPVEHVVVDAPGRYVFALDAPDGRHELTVRAFSESGRLGTVDSDALDSPTMTGFASGSALPPARGDDASVYGGLHESTARRSGRPRIRLDGDVDGPEVVVRADPRLPPTTADAGHARGHRRREGLSVEFLLDDRDDLDAADASVEGSTLRIPVARLPTVTRVHAVAVADATGDADGHSVADTVRIECDGGDVRVTRPNDPPAWTTDATLYEVYVRGFATDVTADSTFEALETRLDHLDALGVDCLWLTPVLQNDDAPHGYNITDFFAIAEDLGTRREYEAFVEAAHDRGMRVLFDLVLNHSARDHPFFRDAYRNPESAYRDWYEWQDSGEPGTYFDWEKIANFDFDALDVRRYLLDVVDEWAGLVDGFRCDMAWAVPRTFWQELRDRVKDRDGDFLLLDETIPYVADFHEGMFDVHFDTTLYFVLRQVGRGDEPADAILDAIDQRATVGFPDHAAFMLYQENHDETRYLVECGVDAAMASAGALFTLPGVPMLYGGQELGQRGRRDALAWDHAREEFCDHYEALSALRRRIPALGFDGAFRRVDYESDTDRAVAFAREAHGQEFVVLLNFGTDVARVVVGDVAPTNLLTGRSVADDGAVAVDHVAVLERPGRPGTAGRR